METSAENAATGAFEERVRSWEEAYMWERGTRSYPARREHPESDSPIRTPFQRDRDRIVHSKAFRRLKHKTQVFVAPEGDHYRTRLTHTLEACFISRTVSRALGLNEDLTEAIGLGHDLGHPPFGHIGEEVLAERLAEHGRTFKHNEHSLRVVEVLEGELRGLNLTAQVRDGILRHTGSEKPATLEGRVVRIVDRVAYINHDIDDAVRAGILSEGDLPAEEIELLGATGPERVDALVRDMVERSREAGDIVQSDEVGGAMLRLRKFMFDRVYLGEEARREQERAREALGALFAHYLEHPEEVPSSDPDADEVQRVTDYLAGMTDRFCLSQREILRSGAAGGGESPVLMGFSQTSIDRVREAVDFVEVVSQYTDLKRAGQRFSGLCPFHDERSPSFSVDPVGKYYKCFGCDVGGDVFRFVEEKEGLTFPEALEALAERYGVEIERESEDPRAEEARRHRARIQELLARTAEFYERFLWDSPKAEKAREYLLGRGLSEKALREFGVGMAPQAWDQVLVGSQRAGYKVVELESAGLVQKGRQGSHYDRFRSRITFPIRDARGRVIGFGARALTADSKPKYLNSPEGVFKKSESLYGIDKARPAIAKSRRAIVVEGYTDVIALHQAGIEDVVAIMGTAITPDQLKKLAGLGVEKVQLALDADSAGANAMIRAQRVAAERTLELQFAAMPEGEDPADMLEAGEGNRFRQIIDESIDYGTFRVRTTLDRADLGSPTGRDRALKEIAPVMQAMGETVTRDELMKEVVDRLDTDVHRVTEAVRHAKAEDLETVAAGATGTGGWKGGADGSAPAPRAPLTPREARERALLAMCIADPAAGREYLARLDPGHLSASGRPALEWLRGHLDDPVSDLPRDDADLVSLVTELAMRAERDPHSAGSMELNFMLLEQQRLEDGIAAAREAGDMEEVQRLSREGSDLTTRISQTESFGQ